MPTNGPDEIQNLIFRLHTFHWRLYCRALDISHEDQTQAGERIRRLLLEVANGDSTIPESFADYVAAKAPPPSDDPAVQALAAAAADFHKKILRDDRELAAAIVGALRAFWPAYGQDVPPAEQP
jgi:hypothetical protein